MVYARYKVRDFESYRRIFVGLDEDDVRLIFKQPNSYFITYEIPVGIYSIEDIEEPVYTTGDHEATKQIDYDDISMKTKHISTHFVLTFGRLRFDVKSLIIFL